MGSFRGRFHIKFFFPPIPGLFLNPTDAGRWRSLSCPNYCSAVVDPICGSDGVIYKNDCDRRKRTCGTGTVKAQIARKPWDKGSEGTWISLSIVDGQHFSTPLSFCDQSTKVSKNIKKFPDFTRHSGFFSKSQISNFSRISLPFENIYSHLIVICSNEIRKGCWKNFDCLPLCSASRLLPLFFSKGLAARR